MSHRITHNQRAKLIRMATQIAEYFKSYSDERAIPAIAEHINQFWHERMRERLLQEFHRDTSGFPPLIVRSLPLVRGKKTVP